MMSLFDWLPLFPWEGLPLPRFLGVYWPWAGQQPTSLPKLPSLRQYVSDIKEEIDIIPEAPLASYQNEESWEIEWSDDGLPRKITVHRQARRS